MTPRIGDSLKVLRIAAVNSETMQAWAKFLHDPNPIHLDPAAVKAKGLGNRVINQGPTNLAYVISMLQGAFPGAVIETLEVRYVDNVFAGDTVEASGKVVEIIGEGHSRKTKCEIWLQAAGRGPVITGTAVVLNA